VVFVLPTMVAKRTTEAEVKPLKLRS